MLRFAIRKATVRFGDYNEREKREKKKEIGRWYERRGILQDLTVL